MPNSPFRPSRPTSLTLVAALAASLASALSAATNCSGTSTITCLAYSETTASGTRQGDYTRTHVQDSVYETLTEQTDGLRKGTDLLRHTWQLDLAAGTAYTFYLRAYRIDSHNNGDNFSFSFSTNGGAAWTSMLSVNTASAALYQYVFTGNVAGSVWIRTEDTNRTAGRRNLASLYVDRLWVQIATSAPPPSSAKRVAGYFASWSIYGRNYFVNEHTPGVKHIPAERVSHVNYAFANLQSNGQVVLGDPWADVDKAFGNEPPSVPFKGNFRQLLILKSQHPTIKTLISVGGWTWSNHFSDVFADATKRQTFCTSLLNFVNTYGFDGADLDWEYPGSPGEGDNSYRPLGVDGQNYVTTLALCRPSFAAAGKLLTIASPCNPQTYEDEMNLGGMTPYVDWYNLMNYDLHGPWDTLTGHHSQLYRQLGDPDASSPVRSRFNGDACVSGYLNKSVPAEKLVLGLPFYGRSYAQVNPAAGGNPAILGLFQTYSGLPKGTWDTSTNTGIFDYEDIIRNVLPAGTRAYDTGAAVPTLTWNLDAQGLGFLSYDDRASTCNKGRYALNRSLGGLMFWEFSADFENHAESLAAAAYCGLNPSASGCSVTCP